MDAKPLEIVVVSDVVCPWCFVGKRRLAKALEQWTAPASVLWAPYELAPHVPPSGMPRDEYFQSKGWTPEQTRAASARLEEVGREVGIAFRFDLIQRQPNTRAAHRLIWFAQQHDRQDAVVEGLFTAFFLEGLFIGDTDVLLGIAEAAGLDRALVAAFLAGDEGASEIEQDELAATEIGISGVPYFIANGYGVASGAQPPDVLVQGFRAALAMDDSTHGEPPPGA